MKDKKPSPVLTLLMACAIPACSFDGPSARLEFAAWKARRNAEPAPLVAPQERELADYPRAPLQPVTQIIVSGKDSRWNDPSPAPRASRPQVEDYSK